MMNATELEQWAARRRALGDQWDAAWDARDYEQCDRIMDSLRDLTRIITTMVADMGGGRG